MIVSSLRQTSPDFPRTRHLIPILVPSWLGFEAGFGNRWPSVVFGTLSLERCVPVCTNCKPRQIPRAVSGQPRCQQRFHIHVHTCLFHQAGRYGAQQPFKMDVCVFQYSVALMTLLWTKLYDCSSSSSPFLKQLGDVLHALFLVILDHDLLETSEVIVAATSSLAELSGNTAAPTAWNAFSLVAVRSHCGEASHAPTLSRSDYKKLCMASG